MAYIYQLKDAQNDVGLKNVCGVATSSTAFTALVNEVQRRLARRGDWYGLTQTAVFIFQGCVVTWPRYVGTIIGARSGQCKGIRPQNMWYSFTGSYHHHHSHWHADLVLEDAGQHCTFGEITGGGAGQLVRFYIEKANDIGKKITIYGRTFGNQPLQQQDASGNWIPGVTLTAQLPFASTSANIIKIDSIIKEPMQGYSRLYEYDATSDTLRDVAYLEPNETNPTYRRSTIVNFRNRWHPPQTSTPVYNEIEVLVKLAFVPVVTPLDFLLVDNFDALKLGVQAVKAEEAGDNQTAEAFWLKAIRELNFEDRDKEPDNYTPIKLDATMCHRTLHNPC